MPGPGARAPGDAGGAAVSAARVVWIDLRCVPQQRGLALDAQAHVELVCITQLADVARTIARARPHFACVEYDYPDGARLAAVPLLRRDFPQLPLLMFTEYHTEALAVWAFRHRVWDYRVKPVSGETLARLFEALIDAAADAPTRELWSASALPPELRAPAGHLRKPLIASTRTAAALAWIGEHYAEACPIKLVAGLCHLSESEFSRAFHREHGASFCHFLLHYRVAMAREFLAEPGALVSQVAYAVGFNDLSYFGRVFRRVVGMSATHYQRVHAPTRVRPAALDGHLAAPPQR